MPPFQSTAARKKVHHIGGNGGRSSADQIRDPALTSEMDIRSDTKIFGRNKINSEEFSGCLSTLVERQSENCSDFIAMVAGSILLVMCIAAPQICKRRTFLLVETLFRGQKVPQRRPIFSMVFSLMALRIGSSVSRFTGNYVPGPSRSGTLDLSRFLE